MNDAQPVNPNYVLNCRSVLITWPQSGDLTKEALLEGLRNIPALPIQYIIIGKEQHATTGGVHLHAYIVCERKCHIRSATNVFTFNGNKPNFAVSRVQRHTSGITYVSKDGDFIEWGVRPEEKKRNVKGEVFLKHTEESRDANALVRKLLSDPVTAWDTARSFGAVTKAAEYIFPGTRLGGCPWELEDFKTPPSLLEWVANNLVSM